MTTDPHKNAQAKIDEWAKVFAERNNLTPEQVVTVASPIAMEQLQEFVDLQDQEAEGDIA